MNWSNIFLSALEPYTRNKNTGNVYEIAVALELIRKMGIPNSAFDQQRAVIETIITYNTRRGTSNKGPAIRKLFEDIRTKPVGTGLSFDGKIILCVECITQEDNKGSTGDFLLHYTASNFLSLSVTGGIVKADGTIEKCISNPTCKRYGCTPEDIENFKSIAKNAVEPYKKYMTENYGSDQSIWPRVSTPIAVNACSEVAKIAAERFPKDSDKKRAMLNDILHITGTDKPADYLAVVHNKNMDIRYFKFGSLKVNPTEDIKLVSEGIWLVFKIGDSSVGKTQVKFNNGVYHNVKTSSLTSSWNANFNLTDLFEMNSVNALPPSTS